MKVFVTGASGFVGREVLRQLHAAGHSSVVLARNPDSPRLTETQAKWNADVRLGDVLDPASLKGALNGIDAVIHLVGIIAEVGANTFEKVHTDGTRNIADAARAAGIKRFVHMSALGTRPNAVARYHKSKWAAEELLCAGGFDLTIFRPSIIYGPEDMFVNMFARMARRFHVLPVIGSGEGKLQPIPVSHVATCFVQALSEPRSIGQTFDLCGPEPLTFLQVLDEIAAAADCRALKLHLPMPVARLQAAMLEFFFSHVLHKAPPLNRDQLLMIAEDNVGDPRPANVLFGLQPIPFRDGISQYLTRQ